MKTAKLFRSGGSYAVRIPKGWLPSSGEVVLRKEGRQIIIEEKGSDLRALSQKFADDGLLEFKRPEQPHTPEVQEI